MLRFRNLNQREKDVLNSLRRQGLLVSLFDSDTTQVSYRKQVDVPSSGNKSGDFTICCVGNGSDYFVGSSHRSYKDKPSKVHGELLAFRRAVGRCKQRNQQ